ncbi:MAG: DNA polymerase III subunit beta [Candidatus Shapirobacteria bacterium]|nr:DNA polymerase III subunit beta [Candidatus Shapirobacteria bacterium]
MKITLLQENLNKGLSIVGRFVAPHPQIPILNHVAIKTDRSRLKISATNLETGVNYYCGAKIDSEGGTTVLARTFSDFVASLPAEKIVLRQERENLNVSCGNYQADLPTSSISDFPKIPTKVSQKLSLPYQKFIQALGSVVFATSSDDSRPVLSGVNFKFTKDTCLLSATDGYRLSFKKISLEKKFPQLEFIIPSVVLSELVRSKPEGDLEQLELGLASEEKQAVFFLPNLEFSSRLLEGEYPDIDKVIPQDKETTVIVDREEFLGAVKMAAIFARESANTIKLLIADNKIQISANAPVLGENTSQIEAQIEGEDQKVAFNFRFLIDLLTALKSDQIIIELQQSEKPVVFKNPKDRDFLHIIMPVKIQEEE